MDGANDSAAQMANNDNARLGDVYSPFWRFGLDRAGLSFVLRPGGGSPFSSAATAKQADIQPMRGRMICTQGVSCRTGAPRAIQLSLEN